MKTEKIIISLLGIVAVIGLYLASQVNYLLVHTLIELFSIAVAVALFIIAWNTWHFTRNSAVVLLGVAYLFVGGFDLLHTLAYKGMTVFPGTGANLPTQFWIAARYLESLSLLAAVLLDNHTLNHWRIVAGYAILVLLTLLVILTGGFPACFVEGQGLTPFKIVSEYLICLILGAALLMLRRNRRAFDPALGKLLAASIVLTISSEVVLTFYSNVYDRTNLVGHVLKILSFYLIYKAIVEIGLTQPYSLLAYEVKQHEHELREARDSLEQQVAQRTAALQQSEERFRTVSELTSDYAYAFRVEPDGRLLEEWVTAPFKQITGFTPAELEARGGWATLVHPDDRPIAQQRRQRLLTGQPDASEFRIITKSGTIRWIRDHGRSIRDEQQERVVRIYGAAQDITAYKQAVEELQHHREHLEELVKARTTELQQENAERQQAEAALRKSEASYRFLAEHATDMITRNAADGTILYLSPAVESLFGYTVEEYHQFGPFDNIHPDDVPILRDAAEQLLQHKTTTAVEYRVRHKAGHYVWVESSSQFVASSSDSGEIVIVTRDITKRKQTEEALKQALAEARRRTDEIEALLTGARAVLADHHFDEAARIIFYQCSRIIGAPAGYIALMSADGQQNEVLFLESGRRPCSVDPDLPMPIRGLRSEAYRTCQTVYDNDFAHSQWMEFMPEGHVPLENVLFAPLIINGQAAGVMGLANKPGGFIEVDVRLASAFAEHAAIALRNARNLGALEASEKRYKQAKEEAEQASQAKSAFLAHMSHELRTPLNGILGYTQILQRDQALAPTQAQAIETIHHSGRHLLMLINDILDLAKIEAGRLELEAQSFSLPGLIRDIDAMIRIRAEQKGLTFSCDINASLPETICGDEKRLRQILLNLLSNAVKFTDYGAVSLKVDEIDELNELDELNNLPTRQLTNSKTHQLKNSKTRRLRFEVADTGVGIPSEALEQIFDPFHQIGDQHVQAQGTGLGLAISRQIVEKMGSRLQVKSTPGRGSAFWFEIKVSVLASSAAGAFNAERGAGPGKRSRSIVRVKGPQRKILLVDDNPENRMMCKDMLAPLGFAVIEAGDGQEGIDKAGTTSPDLILMDLVMPGMDGWETTRRIRQLPGMSNTIVIGLSASAFDETRRQSMAAGCDDFLPKPVDLTTLLEKIEQLVQVEWLYADNADERPGSARAARQAKPITPPPPEVIGQLYDLAQLGDIMAIQELLEAQPPAYNTFVTKLRPLVAGMRITEVRRFLESYLPEKAQV